MTTPTPKNKTAANVIVWTFAAYLFAISAWPQKESLPLVVSLSNSISKSGKRKVAIMPLAGPDGTIDALGAHLSQMLSRDLSAALPDLELIDPKTLHLPENVNLTPGTEADSTSVLRNLAKNAGAEICVIGDFAPFQEQLGVSLRAYSADDSLLSESYGEIPIGAGFISLASRPLKYTPPPGGIFPAGIGGISKPKCLNCSTPGGSSKGENTYGSGFATMDVVVDAEGRTRDVKILDNSNPAFGSKAKQQAQALKYAPAKTPDGNPVAVHFQTEFVVVELEITVAADGSVSGARVIQSPKKTFSDRALDAVKKWKLKPATDPHGRPVVVVVPMEISFRLSM